MPGPSLRQLRDRAFQKARKMLSSVDKSKLSPEARAGLSSRIKSLNNLHDNGDIDRIYNELEEMAQYLSTHSEAIPPTGLMVGNKRSDLNELRSLANLNPNSALAGALKQIEPSRIVLSPRQQQLLAAAKNRDTNAMRSLANQESLEVMRNKKREADRLARSTMTIEGQQILDKRAKPELYQRAISGDREAQRKLFYNRPKSEYGMTLDQWNEKNGFKPLTMGEVMGDVTPTAPIPNNQMSQTNLIGGANATNTPATTSEIGRLPTRR